MAARISIAHDDFAAQRAVVEQLLAEPYTGARAVLPRIRRPRPLPLPPTGALFASLPEQRRPPRPWEQPPATEAASAPAPWAMTPEELAGVEALVIGRYKGDAETKASCRRWDEWITDGRSPATEILQLPGVNASGYIDVLETRLGWSAKISYATTKKCLAHGRPIRPDFDDAGLFFWETRDAAVQYAAYRAWYSAQDYQGKPDRVRRAWERFADEMREFFKRCGIDVTEPPALGLKRVVMTRARERELGKLAEAEKAAAKAVPTVPEAECPAGAEPGIWRLCKDVIDPPSPLALKRKRLRIEREEADRAAAEAEAPQLFNEEETTAIEHLAWGEAMWFNGAEYRKAWTAFIARGAVPTEISIPMPKGFAAHIRITETRLGFTAGYDYEEPACGCGGGGFLVPQVDGEGWFLWSSRQAAMQEAANELWSEFDYEPGKELIRAHFASMGIDVTGRAGDADKRRLVSRAYVDALRGKTPPDVAEPSMDAVIDYERAVSITDHDGPTPS